METFSVNIPLDDEEAMNQFQKFMDLLWDENQKYTLELAQELGITENCASDIVYLRSRSRWTQEKENYLIWLDQHNMELPNFNDDFDVPENYL
jgi:hypothetical protein